MKLIYVQLDWILPGLLCNSLTVELLSWRINKCPHRDELSGFCLSSNGGFVSPNSVFESRHYPKLAHRVCRWIIFTNYSRLNRRQTFIRVNADAEPHNRSSWTNFPKTVSEVDCCSAGGKFQRRKVVADCWKAFWSFPFASCPGILCVHQAAGFKKGKQKTVSDKKHSWHKNFSFGKNFHRNINFHSKR